MVSAHGPLPVIDADEADEVASAFEEAASWRHPIEVAIGQNDVQLSPGMMAFLAAQIRGVHTAHLRES